MQSVIIDSKGHAIDLHYDLTRADAQEAFSKNQVTLYLIDEILHRTVKMHRERTYCMRFLRPMIQIDSVNVKVNVFKSSKSTDRIFSIGYRLEDKGYPTVPEQGIYDICPELSTWRKGQPLNAVNHPTVDLDCHRQPLASPRSTGCHRHGSAVPARSWRVTKAVSSS